MNHARLVLLPLLAIDRGRRLAGTQSGSEEPGASSASGRNSASSRRVPEPTPKRTADDATRDTDAEIEVPMHLHGALASRNARASYGYIGSPANGSERAVLA